MVWLFGLFGSQRWTDTNVAQAYKDAQVIPTFSGEETYQGHILDIYGTYLRCIENIFGHTWNLSERYLNHILRLNFKKKLNVLAITGFFHGLTAFVLNMNGFVLHG